MAHVAVTRARDRLFITMQRAYEGCKLYPVTRRMLLDLQHTKEGCAKGKAYAPSGVPLPLDDEAALVRTIHPKSDAEKFLLAEWFDEREREAYEAYYGKASSARATAICVVTGQFVCLEFAPCSRVLCSVPLETIAVAPSVCFADVATVCSLLHQQATPA
jgi:hypothetical protein